jgi:dipeptidyl-peptidase-4
MKSATYYTIALPLILGLLTLSANSLGDESSAPHQESSGIQLTNEAIYERWEYNAKHPGAVRWLDEGASYSALETAAGYEDAKLEKDQYGDDIRVYEEVVQYDPATLARSILISLKQLTPKGADKALTVDDYQWSDDKSKILIYTNAEYVWRERDRGDYWVRDISTGDLWKVSIPRQSRGL